MANIIKDYSGPTVDDFLRDDFSRDDRLRCSKIRRRASIAGLALYGMVFLSGCAGVVAQPNPKQYTGPGFE